MPYDTLKSLREYWATHKHPIFIFPACSNAGKGLQDAKKTMRKDSVQDPLQKVLKELKISKRVTPHTFRHSYATHSLNAGMNVRSLQLSLGHSSLSATCIYLHLTKAGKDQTFNIVNDLMGGFLDGND